MSLIDSWEFNLILYLISNVVFLQSYKAAVRNASDESAAAVSLQLIAGGVALLIAPIMSFQWPTSISAYVLLAVAIVFYAINDRLQVTVRRNLDVSIYTIIGQGYTAILFAFGLVIFGESVTLTQTLGALLVVGAITLLFVGKAKSNAASRKYQLLAVVVQVIFATAIAVDVGISEQFNLSIYVAITLIIPAALIALQGGTRLPAVNKEFALRPRMYLLCGVSWTLTIIFSLRAFQLGEVVVVAPLQTISVLLNVIVASIIFRERTDIQRRFIASAGVILGAFLLV